MRLPLFPPVMMLLPLAAAAVWGQPPRVGQWDRFETVIPNPEPYDDPFRDVDLSATFTAPGGETVEFRGFYDGDGWKLRFMPDRLGAWRYTARFSDDSRETAGEFECVPSDLPGMIAVDEANPMWFGFKGGGHGMIRSLHVGDRFFARNWPDEKRTRFLDWLTENRYNTLSIASHYLNRDSPGRGRGWDTPDLWPPNPTEYRRMEAVLDELARRRIVVFPFAGFFGRDSDYPTDPREQALYVRYTLARLAPYWNLLWNVAGPEPNLKNRPFLSTEEVTRLGRLIASLDPFGHPVSVHNRTGDDPYRDSDWTTYGVIQGPKTLDREKLNRLALESHHPEKPLYAQETLWPGNKYHPAYGDDDIRKNAYTLILSAAAINFADMDGDSSSGFGGSLELEDRVQSRHDIIKKVWDFFETLPFYRMGPRQDLVDNGFCLAEPGVRYLVYLEKPGEVALKAEPGPYRAEWIDAQDTSTRHPLGVIEPAEPLQTPAGGDDWLLYVVKERQ